MKFDVIVITLPTEDTDGFIHDVIGDLNIQNWEFLAERVTEEEAERLLLNLKVEVV